MILIRKIDGTVEELLEMANLRECDMARFEKITNPTRQAEWLMSKVMVWEALQKHVDYTPQGAPLIEGGYISVSHSNSYVAVCLSDKACGIDIENIERNAARIVRKFAVEQEIEIVKQTVIPNPELLVWCAKEALYKYAGIEGADFIRDFKILSASNDTLVATAFGSRVGVRFEQRDDILIAYC